MSSSYNSLPLFQPLNYYKTLPVMHPSQNYESYRISREMAMGFDNTVKKIKQGDISYCILNQTKLQPDYPINTPPQHSKLLVKGHCYNLNGFYNKPSHNIKVVTDRKNENETLIKSSILANKIQTVNNSAKVTSPINQTIFEKPLTNKNICNYVPGSDLSNTAVQSLFQYSQQMKRLIEFVQNRSFEQNLKVPQPLTHGIKPSFHTKVHSKVIFNKPLSTTAQLYIQAKTKKIQGNLERTHKGKTVKEIKVRNIEGNVTLDFSSSNFSMRIVPTKDKREDYRI